MGPRGKVIGKYWLHKCDLFMILKTKTKQIKRTVETKRSVRCEINVDSRFQLAIHAPFAYTQ